MNSQNGMWRYRQTVIVAIVGLIVLAVALVIGAEISGFTAKTTPLVTTVLGVITPTIVGLLALLNSEKVNAKVDGHLSHLTNEALNAHAESAVQAERDKVATKGNG